jgi:hypothetical protein
MFLSPVLLPRAVSGPTPSHTESYTFLAHV